MKIQIVTLFLIVCFAGTVHARLGETAEQLTARYGDVIGKEHIAASGVDRVEMDQVEFKKSGFNVTVMLFNDVSAQELISNIQGDALSDVEIKTLLDANAQGHTWKEVKGQLGVPWPEDDGTVTDVGGEKMWQRDDGAVAMAGGNKFRIKSKALIDAQVAAYKAAHVHSLDGF